MRTCNYCQKEFDLLKNKAIYCSSKCRTYAYRKSKTIKPKDIEYFIDKNNVKHRVTKNLLLRLLSELGETNQIINDPANNVKINRPDPIISKDSLPVNYQKEFNECEFDDERKSLWFKIKSDSSVTEKDKNLWKIRIGIK